MLGCKAEKAEKDFKHMRLRFTQAGNIKGHVDIGAHHKHISRENEMHTLSKPGIQMEVSKCFILWVL